MFISVSVTKLEFRRVFRWTLKNLLDSSLTAKKLTALFPAELQQTVKHGVQELLFNAIEHGALNIGWDEKTKLKKNFTKYEKEISKRLNLPEYSSQTICISYIETKIDITFRIKDHGQGFNWKPFLQGDVTEIKRKQNHGKGITMSQKLSFENITYNEIGNEVTCIIDKRKLSKENRYE